MENKQKENLLVRSSGSLTTNSSSSDNLRHIITSSEPLWKRAPTRDLTGKPYADFMMLIPGLSRFELAHVSTIINKIETVLNHYQEDIILADLNLKINVLWITIKARPGLSSEIAALLHHVVPEAKLVSQHRVSG